MLQKNYNNPNTVHPTKISLMKGMNKLARSQSTINSNLTFSNRYSPMLNIKIPDSKKENKRNRRSSCSCSYIKDYDKPKNGKKLEKDEEYAQYESMNMLNKITKSIIDGDKNLNNPDMFYNELFSNIINKAGETPETFVKKMQYRKAKNIHIGLLRLKTVRAPIHFTGIK